MVCELTKWGETRARFGCLNTIVDVYVIHRLMCRRLAHLPHFSRECVMYGDIKACSVYIITKTKFSHGSHIRTYINSILPLRCWPCKSIHCLQYNECDLTTLFSIVYFDNVFLLLPFISQFWCRTVAAAVVVRDIVAVAAIAADDVVAFLFPCWKTKHFRVWLVRYCFVLL